MWKQLAALSLVVACNVEEPTSSVTSAVTTGNLQMNIVAHEDDDFLFINPDLQQQISAHIPIVTVYITAGEAGGDGRCGDTHASEDEHAHERQRAVQAAYAQMANPSWTAQQADSASWSRELIVPDSGVAWPHTVERYTLLNNSGITLIFMNLREDGDGNRYDPASNPSGSPTIGQMFDDHSLVTDTVVPSCGPAGSCVHSPSCNPDVPWQNYSHDQLVTVLADLVTLYQPEVVRTLDPMPLEITGYRSNLCRSDNYYEDVCFDNLDHRYAARYVDEVLANYHGPNGLARYTVEHYKGYSHTNYPQNIGHGAYQQKFAAGEAYRQAHVYDVYGRSVLDDPYYSDAAYEPDYQSMYERYPASTEWLQRANNGSLVAVSVEDRKVKLWYETSPGGSWTGPVNLGGGAPIAPHVTLLTRTDGRLQIFATRLPGGLEHWPASGSQDVITAIQNTTTMTFGAWQSVGAPDSGGYTGVGTAAIDGTGRIFVFARNSNGLPAYTYSSGSTWAAWQPIYVSAQDVMDGLAAITRNDGVIEVFATSRTGQIEHFVQSGTSTGFLVSYGSSAFNFTGAASAPTVTKNQDGRIEIFYREATSNVAGAAQYGRVDTAWVNTSGAWQGPAVLYGDAGSGPVAAIRRGGTGEIMLFERNTWNGISTTRQVSPNSSFNTQWDLRGGMLDEYPAAATDNLGRVVVAVKGSDGHLWLQRESSSTSAGSFGNWFSVGN
jgi:hypothetical protein